MKATDPHALAAIHDQAFPSPWTAAEFADLLSQAGVFAVTEAEGFILLRVVLDEAEILTLAVRPSARRKGLGRRLVEAGVVAAAQEGASRLFLEVADDNIAARLLYEHADFRKIGRRKAYYAAADGSRIDAVVMSRDLSANPTNPPLP